MFGVGIDDFNLWGAGAIVVLHILNYQSDRGFIKSFLNFPTSGVFTKNLKAGQYSTYQDLLLWKPNGFTIRRYALAHIVASTILPILLVLSFVLYLCVAIFSIFEWLSVRSPSVKLLTLEYQSAVFTKEFFGGVGFGFLMLYIIILVSSGIVTILHHHPRYSGQQPGHILLGIAFGKDE